VGPVWRGGAFHEPELLQRAYDRAFALAVAAGDVRTIAFPAISTGVYAFPKSLAAEIAVRRCARTSARSSAWWPACSTPRARRCTARASPTAGRAPVSRLIAHVVRQRVEALLEEAAQLAGHVVLVERAVHAPQPLVALALADGEREVPHAQPRVARAARRTAAARRSTREEEVELLARRLEAARVQRPHGRRLGRGVHEVVEAVDEAAHALLAADLRVVGGIRDRSGHAE
jgi:hypothetical protein